MHICHVINHFDIGSGYEEELSAKYASKIGYKVTVLTTNIKIKTPGFSFASRFKKPGIYLKDNIRIIRIPSFPLPLDLTPIPFGILVAKLIDADIYHIHGIRQPICISLVLLSKFLKIKCLIDTHDFEYTSHQAFYKGDNILRKLAKIEFKYLRRNIGRFILESNNYVLSWGKVCTLFLREFYNYSGYVKESFIGFDGTIFKPINKFQNYQENSRTFKLLFVGFLSERKKPILLLKILEFLPDKFTLTIVGGGDDQSINELKDFLEEKKLKGRVKIFYKLSQKKLSKKIQSHHLGIYPSSSSVSCSQIIGCGIPVMISSNQKFSYLAKAINLDINVEQIISDEDLIRSFTKKIIEIEKQIDLYKKNTINIRNEFSFQKSFNTLNNEYKKILR